MITVTKRELANYLVNRSFLHKKSKSINEVLESLTCIQVDPISVVARNHELALWNRVERFKRSDLYSELYEKRSLFEYWLQLFSIIPVKYYPYFRIRRGHTVNWQKEFIKIHRKEIDEVLRHITEHGVTGARDLAHLPKTASFMSWSTGSSHAAALNFLWDRGDLSIHHRNSNQKYYDLAERIIPKTHYRKIVTKMEATRFFLESQFAYSGVIRTPSMARGRLGYVKNSPIYELFIRGKKNGRILEVNIKDVKTKYTILNNDYEKFKKLSKSNSHYGISILPPLDPLVIDRRLLKDAFDFEYTWEAYVPKSKRRFGYYGMPILYNGEFVGQIDLKKDKNGNLTTLNLATKEKSKEFSKKLKERIGELENFTKTQ